MAYHQGIYLFCFLPFVVLVYALTPRKIRRAVPDTGRIRLFLVFQPLACRLPDRSNDIDLWNRMSYGSSES